MGRLLNPGLGDLVDRLSILRLKESHAAGDTDVSHFRTERVQIQDRIDRHPMTAEQRTRVKALATELGVTNQLLWELEDSMRDFATADPERLADWRACAMVGVKIWRSNRRRNEIIHEINETASPRGREKL